MHYKKRQAAKILGWFRLGFSLLFFLVVTAPKRFNYKPKFAFFQKQRERFAVNAVVFAQYTLRLVPKIFNAVDMILALGKRFAMVDAVMDKTAHIQFVITAQAVCI